MENHYRGKTLHVWSFLSHYEGEIFKTWHEDKFFYQKMKTMIHSKILFCKRSQYKLGFF